MTEQTISPEPPEQATTPAGLREADFRGCRWIAGEATPLRPGMFCCATRLRTGVPRLLSYHSK
jgi:hypothetical protein